MSLVFVGDRCDKHSPSSGYDQLCAVFPDAGWLSRSALLDGDLQWHPGSRDRLDESTLFHVLYGDCSGRALPPLLRELFPSSRIVATVHQPAGRMLRDPAAVAALTCVDATITVCEAQAAEVTAAGVGGTVHAAHHGVRAQAWSPPPDERENRRKRRVVLVGSHLRDWAMARAIVAEIERFGLGCVIVGIEDNRQSFEASDLVTFAPRLTEAELASLYNESAALLLPVVDATASNALLEAMAAGCPVIAPPIPALREYIGDDEDTFEPDHPRNAAALAMAYAGDTDRRASRGRVLRSRASVFDWNALAPRFSAIYREIQASALRSALREAR